MTHFEKRISLFNLTMITAGACIGSGIFKSPSATAASLPFDFWILFVWLIVGLVMLTGALSIAELGSMFPQSGGVYLYLRHAYGDLAAFLYGWGVLTMVTSGAIAALSLVLSAYVSTIIELNQTQQVWLSLSVIVVLSWLNVMGVKVGNLLASLITSGKLLGILVIIVCGIVFGNQTIDLNLSVIKINELNTDAGFLPALGVACIGAYFAYGGFHHGSYLAAEVKNASQTLPRGIIAGLLLVILVYVLINFSYLRLLSAEEMSTSEHVASSAISQVWQGGSLFIAVLISLSTLGTISIYTMTTPRLYFALAQDGLFFRQLAAIHPKYKTPANAIILQCIIACMLLWWWQTFSKAVDYIVFLDYIFMAFAVYAVIVLRHKLPHHQRPYKTTGYPAVPLVFVTFTAYVLLSSVIAKPEIAVVCTAFMALGLVAYYFFRNRMILNR